MTNCLPGWYRYDDLITDMCCPCTECPKNEPSGKVVNPECLDLAKAGKRNYESICWAMQSDCKLPPAPTPSCNKSTKIITDHTTRGTPSVIPPESIVTPGSTVALTDDAKTRLLLIIAVLIIGILMILGISLLMVYKRKKLNRRRSADHIETVKESSTQLKRKSLVCEVQNLEETNLMQTTTVSTDCDVMDSKAVSEALNTTATETTYLKSNSEEKSTAKFETFDVGSMDQQQQIINEDEKKSSIVAFHVPLAPSMKTAPAENNAESDDPGRTFVSDSQDSLGGSNDLAKNKNQSNNTGKSEMPPSIQVNYKSKDQAVAASFQSLATEPTCKLEMNGDYNSLYICGTREGFLIQANNPPPPTSSHSTFPIVEDFHKKFKMESTAPTSSAESREDREEEKKDEKRQEDENEEDEEEEEEEDNLRSTIPLLVPCEDSPTTRRSKFAGLPRYSDCEDDFEQRDLLHREDFQSFPCQAENNVDRDDDDGDKQLLSSGIASRFKSCEISGPARKRNNDE